MKRELSATFPFCMAVAALVHGCLFWTLRVTPRSYLPVQTGPASVDLVIYRAASAKPISQDARFMTVPVAEPQDVQKRKLRNEIQKETVQPVRPAEGILKDAKPLEFFNASPKYPYIARKKGWEGTVEIEAVISPDGDVQVARVYKSSGFQVLDDQALKTVRSWRFDSARRGSLAIQSTIIIPVHFQLKGDRNSASSSF